jgi:hypothetical protein
MTSTDVAEVISFARRIGIEIAPRSGGHSLAGYSTTSGLEPGTRLLTMVGSSCRSSGWNPASMALYWGRFFPLAHPSSETP